MPKKRQDLTGRRFRRLVVIRESHIERRDYTYGWMTIVHWLCKCDCGSEVVVPAGRLRDGQVSCGCHRSEVSKKRMTTHGDGASPEYGIWCHIIGRCRNPTDGAFANYGGRGIECRFKDYEHFIEHVGRRPSPKHQIDRVNNDGHYEPGNVRWATAKQNSRNRRKTRWLCYMGIDRPLGDWADVLGIKHGTIYARYQRGWAPEEILYGKAR